MADIAPLPAASLRVRCAPEQFEFETTATVESHPGDLGQARAMEALRFGLSIAHSDYHVFVLGEAGSGKHATTFRLLRERAATEPVPPDLCYLHNFDEPLHPRLLTLPAGRGAVLRSEMQTFIRELGPAIEAALGSDPHTERIDALQAAHKNREETALREIGEACGAEQISLLQTPDGFVFAPSREGEVLTPEAFEALPEAERNSIEERVAHWSDQLEDLLNEFPGWRKALREALVRAEHEALSPAVAHLMREMRERHADLPEVLAFFDAVTKDVLDAAVDGIVADEDEEDADSEESSRFSRYQVKLLVDHASSTGAPVVFENNPGYGNLIGRIEHVVQQGAQVSHFNLIRAGAMHRANGGYLVIDAERLLTQPFAWEGLKRTLRAGEIRIEPPAEAQGWSGSLTLEPQAIPCALKVVMIGDRDLYYTLMEHDPDFAELFKVAADFDDDLPRNPENEQQYARLLAMLARNAGLLPLDRAAVARLVEEGARLAEDSTRLSLQTRRLSDLMREADHFARNAGADRVERASVEAALAARARRCSRYPSRVRESMLDGTTLIATSGSRSGQINGLVVIELAGERFGHPMRISATVRMGDGDVVDIEREAELGGSIHSKGVLILSAFLAARYARHQPLSLSASLVFEQSYAPVEGDSASLAELCALLSALTQLPIEQRYAITGSVNQFGEVQVIGGVNEKIEGFFDLCQARGLDGRQGVVIPAASVRHLMLREDVVEAAQQGLFHIFPVSTVDEAMTVLTGVPAGEPDSKGVMPKGSLNHKVACVLADMTAARHAYAEGDGEGRRRRRTH
ncbi:AAA family ATPase [Azoarcus communis]|uniref:endopeptidase La n=1 Tax=Parazoarcus communis SWub3 = DSM 12120 TaxID=1121029 RepID=A0A323V7B4_9RHOO|nr:ATP-binding protein [Parazoarcus communis]NMG47050.1 AAA family ATPase [Parazoarcus communis]NMG70250.1 AAA family ATPase [Parazoarcus communis SWub3 = DSM 12120]PZA16028.1 ATP-dependent protease [Azoarcus communis] [Parazoarcus communis SWub3 = DSM 12120]